MKIYRIFPDSSTEFCDIERTGFSFDVIDKIVDGIEIKKIDLSRASIKRTSKKYSDFLGTGMSEYFISQGFRTFLSENVKNQNLNFIETKIGKNEYWMLNIIGLRDCMDYEKSEYTVFEANGEPDQITKLKVIENRISKCDIFRIKDDPRFVFVTQELKTKIEELGFTGIEFIDNMNLTYG